MNVTSKSPVSITLASWQPERVFNSTVAPRLSPPLNIADPVFNGDSFTSSAFFQPLQSTFRESKVDLFLPLSSPDLRNNLTRRPKHLGRRYGPVEGDTQNSGFRVVAWHWTAHTSHRNQGRCCRCRLFRRDEIRAMGLEPRQLGTGG